MFETAYLLGSPQSSIILQTRLGNDIENTIEPEPGYAEKAKFELLVKRYGANWKVRRPPTGRYNCAGLVFANRRTSILSPKLYEKILQDDGYRKFADDKLARTGDIVSYVDIKVNEIVHLALIMKVEKTDLDGFLIPWALSKWNSATGEVLHNIYHVSYDLKVEHRIEFWTDRPET